MIANVLCSFMGTVAFSILFNVPKRFYLCCGLTGMAGWLCYCAVVNGTSATMATLLGTMVVVLLSRVLAVWMRCPITVFLVSGIFPLVPGASVYYTAYNLVTGELGAAAITGITAVKLAFAIVLGIVFIISMPKKWFIVNYWRQKIKRRGNVQ